MHKRLVSEGYITKENKVKCSLQQYNQYNDYIDRKMAQLERQTMDEQNVKKRIEVINRNNAQTMKKIREREQYKQHLLERMEMNRQENNLQMLSYMNEMTQQDTKQGFQPGRSLRRYPLCHLPQQFFCHLLERNPL
ncbi:uncharacterized protein LOC142652402 isoform X2 [Rhinoderma darwinii]|uniref:uncharacterized protein LOC142652402 isoform X2 n=1 Tax=Rhinoderma darwinii TaxID=43563 RepID=UPI003F67C6FF